MTERPVVVTENGVTRRCACGGAIAPYNLRRRIYFCRPCKAAYNRRYNRAYGATAASHAAKRAYARSVKGRVTRQRFARSAKGRALERRRQQRRLYIGARPIGYAASAAEAQAINAHIRRRVRAFRAAQRPAGLAKESACSLEIVGRNKN